jgi:hypothetical protein
MPYRTEFLFAHWAVPQLKNLRGDKWKELVTRVAALPPEHPDALAFALTMVRVNGCVRCDSKVYRERGGCANCSRFALTTLVKETEAELLARYRAALNEVTQSLPAIEFLKQAA